MALSSLESGLKMPVDPDTWLSHFRMDASYVALTPTFRPSGDLLPWWLSHQPSHLHSCWAMEPVSRKTRLCYSWPLQFPPNPAASGFFSNPARSDHFCADSLPSRSHLALSPPLALGDIQCPPLSWPLQGVTRAHPNLPRHAHDWCHWTHGATRCRWTDTSMLFALLYG